MSSPWFPRAAPHLHSQGLDVVGAVGAAREVGQVELDLVPAVVQPHGHGADEGLHPSRALVVARPEPPTDVLVIQHLGKEGRLLTPVPGSPGQHYPTPRGLSTPTPPFHGRSNFNTGNRPIFRNSNNVFVS